MLISRLSNKRLIAKSFLILGLFFLFTAGRTVQAGPVTSFTVTFSANNFTAGGSGILVITAKDANGATWPTATQNGTIILQLELIDTATNSDVVVPGLPVTQITLQDDEIDFGTTNDNNFVVRRASSGQTLKIRATRIGGTDTLGSSSATGETQVKFQVNPGAANKLLILAPGLSQNAGEEATSPGDGLTGTANITVRQQFALTVRVVDQFWNTVTSGGPSSANFNTGSGYQFDNGTTVTITNFEGTRDGVRINVVETPVTFTATATGLNDSTLTISASGPPVAEVFPYPNPFRPMAGEVISFDFRLDGAKPVTLKIVDAFGQEVFERSAQGANGLNTAAFTWDGKNEKGLTVAAGIYYVLLDVDGSITSKKRIGVKK